MQFYYVHVWPLAKYMRCASRNTKQSFLKQNDDGWYMYCYFLSFKTSQTVQKAKAFSKSPKVYKYYKALLII